MTASGAQARQAASWSRAILVPTITQQGPLSGRVRNSLNALACEISTESSPVGRAEAGACQSAKMPAKVNASNHQFFRSAKGHTSPSRQDNRRENRCRASGGPWPTQGQRRNRSRRDDRDRRDLAFGPPQPRRPPRFPLFGGMRLVPRVRELLFR